VQCHRAWTFLQYGHPLSSILFDCLDWDLESFFALLSRNAWLRPWTLFWLRQPRTSSVTATVFEFVLFFTFSFYLKSQLRFDPLFSHFSYQVQINNCLLTHVMILRKLPMFHLAFGFSNGIFHVREWRFSFD
jgi:hypothetical protein